MNVKDIVFQNYQGIRRYGVIREKHFLDGWAHFEVDWVDDDKYEQAMECIRKLRNVDHTRHVYRIDELQLVDADKEFATLWRCRSLAGLNTADFF